MTESLPIQVFIADLLYLYAKADQDDLTVDEICAILEKFQADTEAT